MSAPRSFPRTVFAALLLGCAGLVLAGCDSNGGMSEPENQPPTASISLDARDGLQAAFSGAGSTDEDGDIASYQWEFGDESTATGETVIHEYSEGGTYTARLIVEDDQGAADTTSMDVMVSRVPTTFTVTLENVGTTTPVTQSGAFTPANEVEGNNEGPLQPGEALEFSFAVGPNELPGTGMALSFASMFIQSNDVYYAFPPGGVPLFNDNGTPDNDRDDTPIGMDGPVDLTDQVGLYDAGTEVDQTPGSGSNQAPRQDELNQGPEENGNVVEITNADSDPALEDLNEASGNETYEYPPVADGLNLTVRSQRDEATGSIRFTVRLENVSDETATTVNGAPLVISPGSFAVHFDQTPMGEEVTYPGHAPGSPASPGIEAIAEDGRPAGTLEGDPGSAAGNHVQTLRSVTGVTVPLSPGAYASHTTDVQAFAVGESASAGIEGVAEDGDPGTLADELSPSGDAIRDAGTFGDGPLPPGPPEATPSVSFTVDAIPGERLSLATMYIQSNDLFYGFEPEGLPLFSNDAPINGDVTGQVLLYDAGTEVDEAPGLGLTQAPRQTPNSKGTDEGGTIVRVGQSDDDRFLDDGGFDYAPTPTVLRMTITPEN
jgi:PKD repeat protein